MGCGSTIGPIIASGTGIRTIDVGCPQWSMHSAREVMGTDDVIHAVRIYRSAYTNYTDIDKKLEQRSSEQCVVYDINREDRYEFVDIVQLKSKVIYNNFTSHVK